MTAEPVFDVVERLKVHIRQADDMHMATIKVVPSSIIKLLEELERQEQKIKDIENVLHKLEINGTRNVSCRLGEIANIVRR